MGVCCTVCVGLTKIWCFIRRSV